MSESALSRFGLAGTGILIASALAIIIPEGEEALYLHHTIDNKQPDAARSPMGHYGGLAMVAGFTLMYFIEQVSAHVHTSSGFTNSYVAVDNLHELHQFSGSEENSAKGGAHQQNPLSTTIGLCIHSLADGIAIGSSATSSISLSTVVFMAILLHKGPAAFALVAVLLQSGLARRTLQLHLFLFSVAAPVGALITYALISLTAGDSSGASEAKRTGLVLLFSGGTFLFVACSHLPRKRLAGADLLSLIGGLLVPVIISITMRHDH